MAVIYIKLLLLIADRTSVVLSNAHSLVFWFTDSVLVPQVLASIALIPVSFGEGLSTFSALPTNWLRTLLLRRF